MSTATPRRLHHAHRLHARTPSCTLPRTYPRTHAAINPPTKARLHKRAHAQVHAHAHIAAHSHAPTHARLHTAINPPAKARLHKRTHAQLHALAHARTPSCTPARSHAMHGSMPAFYIILGISCCIWHYYHVCKFNSLLSVCFLSLGDDLMQIVEHTSSTRRRTHQY
eukprot:jgi/Mesvir1/8678/Mv26106-RA.1